ncbi:DUF883 C-terminal domain-containing protein [Deinococcus misasensis]|uniref:DUF883 C-terminal domain-containing protein n=1 Tax=Deinococcus misasensis TaxID=392413 RepID=UPI00054EB0E9|nr:DUF883 C-terminal domain-containing protein [Deinococcus misasensis]
MTQSDEAKRHLEESLNTLQESTSLHVKLQQDPLKKIGVAVGAGLLLGVLIGRSTKKTKIVKVAGGKNVEQAKEAAASKGALSGVILTAVGGLVLKVLQEKVLAPKLEELADQLLERTKKPTNDQSQKKH